MTIDSLKVGILDRYLAVTFISTVLADELIEVTQTLSSSLDYLPSKICQQLQLPLSADSWLSL